MFVQSGKKSTAPFLVKRKVARQEISCCLHALSSGTVEFPNRETRSLAQNYVEPSNYTVENAAHLLPSFSPSQMIGISRP